MKDGKIPYLNTEFFQIIILLAPKVHHVMCECENEVEKIIGRALWPWEKLFAEQYCTYGLPAALIADSMFGLSVYIVMQWIEKRLAITLTDSEKTLIQNLVRKRIDPKGIATHIEKQRKLLKKPERNPENGPSS